MLPYIQNTPLLEVDWPINAGELVRTCGSDTQEPKLKTYFRAIADVISCHEKYCDPMVCGGNVD